MSIIQPKRYDVGGFSLAAYQSGEKSPTVVLESGMGATAYHWQLVQNQLANHTTVFAYDRAGQGYSDRSPHERNPQQVNKELHQLLEAAGMKPPYILVAHSFGGLIARHFAKIYPDEVAGIVLVDTSSEHQYDMVPQFHRLLKIQNLSMKSTAWMAKWKAIGRYLAKLSVKDFKDDLTEAAFEALVGAMMQPNNYLTVADEFNAHIHYFGNQSEIPTDLGDLPVTILTAGESVLHQPTIGKPTAKTLNDAHLMHQKKLAEMLSTNTKQIILPKATHLQMLAKKEYANVIVDAVLEMVEK